MIGLKRASYGAIGILLLVGLVGLSIVTRDQGPKPAPTKDNEAKPQAEYVMESDIVPRLSLIHI